MVEYKDYLPMTARQIFYRMVGAYGYEKTEKAYKRLTNYLVRARRARMIPFKAIRDDGTTRLAHGGWDDVHEFFEGLKDSADTFRLDRMQDQDMRVEVWCEAAGMAPQLERVCEPYGITVYSTGGFSSVTVTNEIANRHTVYGKPTHLLHVGDYDPSGVSLYEAMVQDATMFSWGMSYKGQPADELIGVRVALTPEQIDEHGIPTAPPKMSDTRSVNWYDDTAQAEAMPPNLLASTLDEAIKEVIDVDLWQATIDRENEDRENLRDKLDSIDWGD